MHMTKRYVHFFTEIIYRVNETVVFPLAFNDYILILEYQRLYNVDVRQVEAPGLYKYYSTQRPVDIGTFPKPSRNAPDEIVNYDQRVPVENGAFLAWGHLTYTRPLTKRQTSDYELRPAPDNPDRPRSIREQMKTAAKQAEADRGQAAPKKNAPDRGDR